MLFEKLCEIYANKERVDLSKFYLSYVFVLLSPQYAVRKFAQDTLKKLFKWNPSKLMLAFYDAIETCLVQFGAHAAATTAQSDGGLVASDAPKWPSNKAICESLLVFSATPNLTLDELEAAVLHCLLPANLTRTRSVRVLPFSD